MKRFWDKVQLGPGDECWHWTASKSKAGAGCFTYEGRMQTAHRVAYILTKGDPGKKRVRHSCGNKWCVNPSHLYIKEDKT